MRGMAILQRARSVSPGLFVVPVLFALLTVTVFGCSDSDSNAPPFDGGHGDTGMGDSSVDSGTDAGPDAEVDTGIDSGADVGIDAPIDSGFDGGVPGVTYRKGSQIDANSEFGRSVSIDGDTMVVGAPGDIGGGAVYVFVRDMNGWTETARLVSDNLDDMDRFGGSVSIDGDILVVGAVGERSTATGVDGDGSINAPGNPSGAAYVFARGQDGSWTQQAYLKASNTGANDNFGYAVAVSGDTVAVSAQTEGSNATGIDGDGSNNLTGFSGAVYVFTRDDVTWSQQAYVKASNTGQFDRFGVALALSGNTLAVGAYYEDSILHADPTNNASPDSGAVYVFARDAVTWSQQAYVKASNIGAGDWFGSSVALEGNTLVVGARQEDGLLGDGLSDASNNSGAAYVFERAVDNTWSEIAYLKPDVGEAGDAFGTIVAISGNTIVVGAMEEDSSAAFPDVDPSDNGAENSGAAYVFTREDNTFTQVSYLKASNPDTDHRFGAALDVSATEVVVGAFSERGPGNNATNEGALYIYPQ